ncbi:elongation factor P hydroxylase [Porticoccus sp.]|uniref:elongation factor P hydroxylase n=1 Tax=Porticoccus sp. TaxID=2024853 RepID=UPI0025FD9046|nr:elongation factor P hydroxylase [Porticoccus sp.]
MSGDTVIFDPRTCQLMGVFNDLFADSCNTLLSGGGEEPVYLPAEGVDDCHQLIFRQDYFSSALHEIAHWCIAGEQRRQRVDFGYWYRPDGRSVNEQSAFEQVEIKPQALEWIFSVAAGQRFQISADNLSADVGASDAFAAAVADQAQSWCVGCLPMRAALFAASLSEMFGGRDYLDPCHYRVGSLGS